MLISTRAEDWTRNIDVNTAQQVWLFCLELLLSLVIIYHCHVCEANMLESWPRTNAMIQYHYYPKL